MQPMAVPVFPQARYVNYPVFYNRLGPDNLYWRGTIYKTQITFQVSSPRWLLPSTVSAPNPNAYTPQLVSPAPRQAPVLIDSSRSQPGKVRDPRRGRRT